MFQNSLIQIQPPEKQKGSTDGKMSILYIKKRSDKIMRNREKKEESIKVVQEED